MQTLGYVLMHEHMKIDLSRIKQNPDCCLDCFEETKREMQQLYKHGVRKIWDVTAMGMGRNLSFIERLEQESGMQIMMSTGWYKEPYLPASLHHLSVEEMADIMIGELEEGIDSSSRRAQAIGEIGTSKDHWTACEQKVFDAAIMAHKKTGRPIYTHTTLGTFGLQQAVYFKEKQCDVKRIVIGHMDLCESFDTLVSILETGVTIGFDTIGKTEYATDEQRVSFLMRLEALGYIGQVVLSMDITRTSQLTVNGGIGYSYLFTTFLPMLKAAGMKPESIEQLLITNPHQLLQLD